MAGMRALPSCADAVTSIRLACGPLVIAGLLRQWPTSALLAIAVIAWLSDLTDGWLARRYNTCSPLGAALDQWADASFHSLVALGWLLAAAERESLMSLAVWLHCVGTLLNPLVFPAAKIEFRSAKVLGGGGAFVVDVLLASQTISLIPEAVVLGASVAALAGRLFVLLRHHLRHA
jgi:phosphatidylglycerophosphate synthase